MQRELPTTASSVGSAEVNRLSTGLTCRINLDRKQSRAWQRLAPEVPERSMRSTMEFWLPRYGLLPDRSVPDGARNQSLIEQLYT